MTTVEIFKLEGRRLSPLKQISGRKSDKNEKVMQRLIEVNLNVIFPELEFLKSEYRIKGKSRPDSVAFDTSSNSFVIIEYKNVKKDGGMEQVMDYRRQLLDHKNDFLMMYYKERGIMHENVDFSRTRSIIIAPEFTERQKRLSSDNGIELYEITKYDEGIMAFNYVGNKKEPKTRGKSNQDGQVKTKYTFLSAAKVVLEEAGKPLHYKKIMAKMVERNMVQTSGLRPWDSLRSAISVDRKKEDSVFTAPARGMIGLKSWRSSARGTQGRDRPPLTNKFPNNQYLSAAVKILYESIGPLHCNEITKRAIEGGLLNTTGRTPSATMSSQIYMNIKNHPDSIFKKTSRGMFDLKSRPHTEFGVTGDATKRSPAYSEEDYLRGRYNNAVPSRQTRDLYYKLKNLILETFPRTEAKQTKKYVALRLKGKGPMICTIEVQKDRLKLFYSTDRLGIIPVDSFVMDYRGKGHYGTGDYGSYIKNDHDVGRAIPLIGRIYDLKS